mmetsp:Transcript_28905/g.93197  ORF Transcript_28905/g.93197 Transcript_28905/m.93197 type:complete len:240 (-) Transcript_28905:106-825(-)
MSVANTKTAGYVLSLEDCNVFAACIANFNAKTRSSFDHARRNCAKILSAVCAKVNSELFAVTEEDLSSCCKCLNLAADRSTNLGAVVDRTNRDSSSPSKVRSVLLLFLGKGLAPEESSLLSCNAAPAPSPPKSRSIAVFATVHAASARLVVRCCGTTKGSSSSSFRGGDASISIDSGSDNGSPDDDDRGSFPIIWCCCFPLLFEEGAEAVAFFFFFTRSRGWSPATPSARAARVTRSRS